VLLFLKPSALAILEVFPNEKAKCFRWARQRSHRRRLRIPDSV